MLQSGKAFPVSAVNVEITPEVTPEVTRRLLHLEGEMSRQALQETMGLRDAEHFRLQKSVDGFCKLLRNETVTEEGK